MSTFGSYQLYDDPLDREGSRSARKPEMNQPEPDMCRRDGRDEQRQPVRFQHNTMKGIHMKASIRSVALVGSLALLLAACTPADGLTTTTTASNGTTATSSATTTAPEASNPLSAAELGERFRQALNSGDAAAVAALAPTVASENLQDVIRIGPYDTVNCLVLEGRDVCDISNAGTPYEFVLDLSTGLVTEIFYTGGG